jgi:hypothetical protein
MYAAKDNDDCLSDTSRATVPKVGAFLQQMRDAMDPENCIEEEYHPKHDRLYCWRGLRLLSEINLGAFQALSCNTANGNSLEQALHVVDGGDDKSLNISSVSERIATAEAISDFETGEGKVAAEDPSNDPDERKSGTASGSDEKPKDGNGEEEDYGMQIDVEANAEDADSVPDARSGEAAAQEEKKEENTGGKKRPRE